nr:hypothetical protein [Candidatus Sigynarchaeota archaeon]
MDPAEIETRWKEEKKSVKTTFDRTIALAKDGIERVHYKIYEEHHGWLLRKYSALIQQHVQQERAEFEAYFESTSVPVPVIAFDVEEINNEIICILGIYIGLDLHAEIYLDSVDKAPCADETAKQMKRLRSWLNSKKKNAVLLTHGFNKKEHALMAESGHEFVNTQTLLDEILSK